MMFGYSLLESILASRIDFRRSEKKNYFLLESLLKELQNINHFTVKSILTKSILIKLILFKINSVKVKSNTLLVDGFD